MSIQLCIPPSALLALVNRQFPRLQLLTRRFSRPEVSEFVNDNFDSSTVSRLRRIVDALHVRVRTVLVAAVLHKCFNSDYSVLTAP